MSKLICKICKREIDVPRCCDESMIIIEGLLCCCIDKCHHQQIPECCGQIMSYT